MNETFVVPCWNVTLLFVVMHSLHDLRTGITGYGSDDKYSLVVDGLKVGFFPQTWILWKP
jgi:NADH:ubiquinone oxidoreductase subunit H